MVAPLLPLALALPESLVFLSSLSMSNMFAKVSDKFHHRKQNSSSNKNAPSSPSPVPSTYVKASQQPPPSGHPSVAGSAPVFSPGGGAGASSPMEGVTE